MNERIRELAKQSMWSKTDYSQENELYSFSRDELEKFALSVVQECADIGERYADGNFEVYNQILEHFGVKL